MFAMFCNVLQIKWDHLMMMMMMMISNIRNGYAMFCKCFHI